MTLHEEIYDEIMNDEGPDIDYIIAKVEARTIERVLAAVEPLVEAVEGVKNIEYGTFRGDKGMRLKDTPEWVAFYVWVKGVGDDLT